MANVKISNLPAATSPVASTDVIPVVQGGVTKKAAINQLGFLQSGTGAVTRTAQAKMRDTVSVKDFGAVGDGVTDDTAAIQAAVNASSIVKFPAGVYLLTASVTIPSNKTLDGVGATLRRKTGSSVFDLLKNADQVSGNTDIVIYNLIVDGNKSADSLIASDPADRFSGISFQFVTGKSEISGCTVIGTVNNETGGAIYINDCQDVLVENNKVTDNDRSGVVYFNGARNQFIQNVCYSNTGSGIVGGSCTDAVFANNTTYSNGSGGTHTGLNASCERARVIGNVSYSNTGSGIAIGELAHPSNDAECIGNICYSNTLEGITVQYSDRVRLIGNEFHSNARNNIRVFNGSDDCQVVGNVIRNSAGGQGIIFENGNRGVCIGNTIRNNFGSGVNINSGTSDGICADNVIYDNGAGASAGSAGVLCNTATGWTISNNRIFDTAGAGGTQESGIWMAGGSNNTVSGNILTTNKTNSIRETSSPSYSRRINKTGTDPLQGTFTATAGVASTTINNNNATNTVRIKVWPTNSAALSKTLVVSSIVAGTSFTVTTSSGNFVGTETFAYEIE